MTSRIWTELEDVRRALESYEAIPLPDPVDEADCEEVIALERRRLSLLRELVS